MATSEDITTPEDTQTEEDGLFNPYERIASKVCIVGFADGHRDHAPWDDPDMEFWGINRLWSVLPDRRFHRWFEIHDLAKYYTDDPDHQRFLKEARIPIYVRPQDMPTAREWGIETAVPYPRDDAANHFANYFTNTVSYLLAMAIMMGFEEIHMYGVDMAQDTVLHAEYREQRPSCEYFIGIAEGAGIKVVLPPGSDLLKSSHWYGFDEGGHRQKLQARFLELANRKEKIRGEMSQHQAQAQFLQARISELDGSMQELQYQIKNLITPPPEM